MFAVLILIWMMNMMAPVSYVRFLNPDLAKYEVNIYNIVCNLRLFVL